MSNGYTGAGKSSAAECRNKAEHFSQLASETDLPHVRNQYEESARRWSDLADRLTKPRQYD